MKRRRQVRWLIVVVSVALTVSTCERKIDDIENAKQTVNRYFNDYFERPFNPISMAERTNIYHTDYWNVPGVEGTRISLVDKRIDIVEAVKYVGDKTLYKTRKEELVRIVARMRQHFFISDTAAVAESRTFDVTFYLSKYGTSNGKYLIINYSPLEFDIYYEDAFRDFLKSPTGRSGYSIFRQELIGAGMKGL